MMRAPRYSSRQRLLLSLFCVMVAILGAVAFMANKISRHEAEELFSARLATSARVLDALLAKQLETATISQPFVINIPDEIGQSKDGASSSSGHPYESKLAFQVWSNDKRLLARSATAPDATLGPFTAGFYDQKIGEFDWHVFVMQSGDIWLMTAELDEIREELAQEIGVSVITPLLLGGLLLLLIVNWLALQAIAPMRELAGALSEREPSSLDLIRISNSPIELQAVIDELNSLLLRLQEAYSREKRFLDSAAHELRTPMTAVQIHVQNAMLAKSEHEREESMNEALSSLKRAERLAEQLLALSRIGASSQEIAFKSIRLSSLCDEAAGAMQPIFDHRHQVVSREYSEADQINCQHENLVRLVTNLLMNASNYGAAPGVITLRTLSHMGSVSLVVENEGECIPDQEKENIFTPYYRVLGSKEPGSGLGLPIVQEISRQHGAVVSVEDRPGGGSRFIVRFAR
jgi:two-component system sensor histidine kinase QseC